MAMEISKLSPCPPATLIATTALLLLILLILWRAMETLWRRPKKMESWLRNQGLKGNVYNPLFGDAIELINLSKAALSTPINLSDDTLPRILPFVAHILHKHGNNSFGWVATTPWLIVTDPDKTREILTRYKDFQKPIHPITKLIMVGLFAHEGEKWVKHRKIINPAFHHDKLSSMLPEMYVSCRKMTDLWDKMLSKEGSVELDVWPFLENLTSDVISRAAFGSSYVEGRKIFDLQKEYIMLSMELLQSNYIPGWRFLPTKANRRVKAITKDIQVLLTEIIEKRRRELETGGSNNRDDLLGTLLESNIREIQEHGMGLTTEEVVQECKLFYLAGQETTSSLLVWTLVLLSKHPNWQERARAEILQVFGKDQIPNFDGLNQLKVVSMILNEVVRLYTPAYMLMRKVFKDMKLKEWLIPAGTELVLPLSILHQDRQTWGNDAKEFNPERFIEGVPKAMKGQGLFIPFSSGPRVCIGQNFALLEAKMALTTILQLFSFRLSPTYVHAPFAVISIKPQYGVNLILHKL